MIELTIQRDQIPRGEGLRVKDWEVRGWEGPCSEGLRSERLKRAEKWGLKGAEKWGTERGWEVRNWKRLRSKGLRMRVWEGLQSGAEKGTAEKLEAETQGTEIEGLKCGGTETKGQKPMTFVIVQTQKTSTLPALCTSLLILLQLYNVMAQLEERKGKKEQKNV